MGKQSKRPSRASRTPSATPPSNDGTEEPVFFDGARKSRGFAIDDPRLWNDPTMPSWLKQNGETPYFLMAQEEFACTFRRLSFGGLSQEAHNMTIDDHLVCKLDDQFARKLNVTNKIIPFRTKPEDGNQVFEMEQFMTRPCANGIYATRDFSCAPFSRNDTMFVGYDKKGEEMNVSVPYVQRCFYDDDDNHVGTRILNDMMKPTYGKNLVRYAFTRYPGTDHIQHEWFRKPDGLVTRAEHDEHTGAMRTMHTMLPSGERVNFYVGPSQSERLVSVSFDPPDSAGRVRQFYNGPRLGACLTREVYADGTIKFYSGNVPDRVWVSKVWDQNGNTVVFKHNKRDFNKPIKIADGFEPRHATVVHEPVGAAAVVDEAHLPVERTESQDARKCYHINDVLRVNTSHRRSDVHHKQVHLIAYEKDVWTVKIMGDAPPKPPKGQPHWTFAERDLLTEEDYTRMLAEKAASRAAKEQAFQSRKQDKKTTRQLQADAKLAAKLQKEEEELLVQRQLPQPPPDDRRPVAELLRCPITGALLTDPVLADDGFVYDKTAIHEYWMEKEAIVSPITGAPMHRRLLVNNTLRSAARELDMAGGTSRPKVPDDAPDFVLCPISCDVIESGVLAADGFVYDKLMIEQWFAAGNATSPMTNESMEQHLYEDKHTTTVASAWLT